MGALFAWLFMSAAGQPAAAYDPGFLEVTTQQEVQEFYEKNQDVKKKEEKYKQDVKRREQLRQANPQADERALESSLNDPDVQAKQQEMATGLNPESYMQDLIAEYLVEKGQVVEDNIWEAARVKADAATRRLYRDFLRKVYWNGHAAGDDTGALVQRIRNALETKDGFMIFPREIMGPVPEGAAATYGGGLVTMGPGVLDMAVHSHEWLHWWDDMNGSMDGQRGKEDQIEPYAYDNMGRYYG
ncbi:MAG: hypothetical protein WC728_15230 [Elusimicrobiota bacterium]